MDRREFPACSLSWLRHHLDAGLRFLAATCFIVQTVGCLHHTSEQTAPPHKPVTADKPAVAIPLPLEQPNKTKSVESKPRVLREKKALVPAEKNPDKKLDQTQESSPDIFVPPPPLRPPTFGGAGG